VAARLSSLFWTLVALAILGLGGWVLVRGVLDQPTIVSAFVTAAGAVGVVFFQRDRENKREVALLHREKLAERYEKLIKVFARGSAFGDDPEDLEFLYDLQRQMLLYGATPVVVEWVRWMRSIPDKPDEEDADDELRDPSILLRWEHVLLAIRKDLGHDNKGLMPGDLLRVYIADSDEYVQPWLAAGNKPYPD
jgi:hypothetical protein